MNKYKIAVSPKAKSMLEKHIDYLTQINIDAAINLKDELIASLRSLESMPQRFPLYESKLVKAGKYRKMLVKRRYLIIYQINGDTVFVDYVIDCRENYEWLLM